jgi:hypothetical protein
MKRNGMMEAAKKENAKESTRRTRRRTQKGDMKESKGTDRAPRIMQQG